MFYFGSMEKQTEVKYFRKQADWRKWLEKNHLQKESVWLVFKTKASGQYSLTWSESVDTALCFGWIDSKKIKIDDETSHQYFCKRKPASTWSRINKDKVEQLIEKGLMAEAGLKSIEAAKKNGSWTIFDTVEELQVPEDLVKAFRKHRGSEAFFSGLSKSIRKMMLQWIVLAKKPETRQQRIDQIAELAGKKMKPKQF